MRKLFVRYMMSTIGRQLTSPSRKFICEQFILRWFSNKRILRVHFSRKTVMNCCCKWSTHRDGIINQRNHTKLQESELFIEGEMPKYRKLSGCDWSIHHFHSLTAFDDSSGKVIVAQKVALNLEVLVKSKHTFCWPLFHATRIWGPLYFLQRCVSRNVGAGTDKRKNVDLFLPRSKIVVAAIFRKRTERAGWLFISCRDVKELLERSKTYVCHHKSYALLQFSIVMCVRLADVCVTCRDCATYKVGGRAL